MNTTEVVIREVQSDGGFHICQLFAEGIGESRQPANAFAERPRIYGSGTMTTSTESLSFDIWVRSIRSPCGFAIRWEGS